MSAPAFEPEARQNYTRFASTAPGGSGIFGSHAMPDPATGPRPLSAEARHLDLLCARLHAMVVGRDAQALLEGGPALWPAQGHLLVLPTWVWAEPRVSLGSKAKHLPHAPLRVCWTGESSVCVLPAHAVACIGWSARGLGRDLRDHHDYHPGDGTTTTLSREEIAAALTDLAAAGDRARWDLISWIEPRLEQALRSAHASVSVELGGGREDHHHFDQTALEAIRDRMLLGETTTGRPARGQVAQLLERCLKADTFRRVEPMRYIKEALRRDANAQIRRALGDPHIGRVIRKVARGMGIESSADFNRLDETSLADLVTACRAACPSDPPDLARITAALTVAPDVSARSLSLDMEDADALYATSYSVAPGTGIGHPGGTSTEGERDEDAVGNLDGATLRAAAERILASLTDPALRATGVSRHDREQVTWTVRRLLADEDHDGLRIYLGPWLSYSAALLDAEATQDGHLTVVAAS